MNWQESYDGLFVTRLNALSKSFGSSEASALRAASWNIWTCISAMRFSERSCRALLPAFFARSRAAACSLYSISRGVSFGLPMRSSLARIRAKAEQSIASCLWRLLAPRFEAALTDRLLAFYDGLLEREQISWPRPVVRQSRLSPERPRDACSLSACGTQLGRVLPFAEPPCSREQREPEHV